MSNEAWQDSRMRELCEWADGLIDAEVPDGTDEETRRCASDFLAAIGWTYEQNGGLPRWQMVWAVVTDWRADKQDFLNRTLGKFRQMEPSVDREVARNILAGTAADLQRFVLPMSVAMVALMNSAGIRLPGQPG
jgi:hypothetical protein